MSDRHLDLAADVIAAARHAGISIGTAESLTGGRISQALTSVPGASAVFKGGVVAYGVEAKERLLKVPRSTLAQHGPVSHPVASAMARGARDALQADLVVSSTGVAGPDPHGDQPVGTVVIAVVSKGYTKVSTMHLEGDREQISDEATVRGLAHLLAALATGYRR